MFDVWIKTIGQQDTRVGVDYSYAEARDCVSFHLSYADVVSVRIERVSD